jgi:hypothetical protein
MTRLDLESPFLSWLGIAPGEFDPRWKYMVQLVQLLKLLLLLLLLAERRDFPGPTGCLPLAITLQQGTAEP